MWTVSRSFTGRRAGGCTRQLEMPSNGSKGRRAKGRWRAMRFLRGLFVSAGPGRGRAMNGEERRRGRE